VRFYSYLVASVVCGVLDFLKMCSTCHLSSTGLYVKFVALALKGCTNLIISL
jgi:hypothetical protein